MSNNNNNNNHHHLVTSHSATFHSPEVSPYIEPERAGPGFRAPRGWCSERVPLSSYRTRRHVAASALMPFSSGRTLPSKWDDAERWISSPPVSSVGNVTSSYYYGHGHGHGFARSNSHLLHHYSHSQRRTKSKSGPLGPGGLVSYGSFNSYSPVLGMGVIHGGNWRNSVTVYSPTNLVRTQFDDDHLLVNGQQAARKSCPGGPDWLDLWSGPLSPNPKGGETDNNEGMDTINQNQSDEVGVDRIISRRDMATQMFVPGEMSSSPSSVVSTPKSSISTSHSPCPQLDEANKNVDQSHEYEVRDVQVDKQINTSPRSNSDSDEVYHDNSSNSTIFKTDKKISKLQREEARIKAWENLQKAKAEAAMQKLEMELEKKRSLSMEKIVEKLRRAQIKAQKMRSSLSRGDDGQIQRHVARSASKLPSFCRKIRLGSSAKSCSTCYPF